MIQVTKRDIEMMRVMNAYGFVDAMYLVKRFCLQEKLMYRRLKKLLHHQYLKHERILYGHHGVYWVGQRGLLIAQDPLPAIKQIRLATFKHQLLVLHASHHLVQQYHAKFLTERQLRHKSILSGVGVAKHICDGALLLPDKKVALEVELSMKSATRLKRILESYALQIEYDEVWYLCGDEPIYKRLKSYTEIYDWLKVHRLKTLLQGDHSEQYLR